MGPKRRLRVCFAPNQACRQARRPQKGGVLSPLFAVLSPLFAILRPHFARFGPKFGPFCRFEAPFSPLFRPSSSPRSSRAHPRHGPPSTELGAGTPLPRRHVAAAPNPLCKATLSVEMLKGSEHAWWFPRGCSRGRAPEVGDQPPEAGDGLGPIEKVPGVLRRPAARLSPRRFSRFFGLRREPPYSL